MQQKTLEKIYSGRSRTEAVRLFCKECMGYDGHLTGTPHIKEVAAAQWVKACDNKRCPLWPYRLTRLKDVYISWETECKRG